MADDVTRRNYWAAAPLREALPLIDQRVQAYYDHLQDTRILALWRSSNRAAFSGFHTGGMLWNEGKAGEITAVEVNDYGNLRQHLLTMITGQRPTMECRAKSVDHEAQAQVITGNAVIETAMAERGLEDVSDKTPDLMLRAGEGWGLKLWDEMEGEVYTVESVPQVGDDGEPVLDDAGKPVMQNREVRAGDLKYMALHPIDVARDCQRPVDEARWLCARLWVNRWDLIAEHPELEDQIQAAPSKVQVMANRPMLVDQSAWSNKVEPDDIALYVFMHGKSPALRDGRMVKFIGADCAIEDDVLPYDELPLYREAAFDLEGYAVGYSLLWDLLAPQAALNAGMSTVTSIVANAGIPTVWFPDGTPPQFAQLGPFNMIQGGQTPPQVLQLGNVGADTYKLIEMYLTAMERISAVNSTFRGQGADKGLSGAAYALFAARAIEFAAKYQKAHYRFLERITTGTLKDYQARADAPHEITVAGAGGRQNRDTFTKGQIDKLTRVRPQMSNPLQATVAGKMQILQTLMEMQPSPIHTPEEVIQVLTTGRLEPATQATQKQLSNIQAENELLAKGPAPEMVPGPHGAPMPVSAVKAMLTDQHHIHIVEHASVLGSPEARDNPAVVQAVTAHIQEHVGLWIQTAQEQPAVLQANGVPLPPMPAPPPMPIGPDGAPVGPGGPLTGGDGGKPLPPGMAQEPGVGSPGAQAAEQLGARMPNIPAPAKNPLDGQIPQVAQQ